MSFEENLRFGKIAESEIAKYFLNKGYAVLPIYEKEISEAKGPQLFFPNKELVATDMLVMNQKKAYWIEAKHKKTFTFHKISKRWTTGIDLHHYRDYLEIASRTEWPVWLMFCHKGKQEKNSPILTPKQKEEQTGIFGRNIEFLSKHENHRHKNWGKSGMVYWAHQTLLKVASLRGLENAN